MEQIVTCMIIWTYVKKEAASVTLDILISKESASEPKYMHNKFVHSNGSLTHP